MASLLIRSSRHPTDKKSPRRGPVVGTTEERILTVSLRRSTSKCSSCPSVHDATRSVAMRDIIGLLSLQSDRPASSSGIAQANVSSRPAKRTGVWFPRLVGDKINSRLYRRWSPAVDEKQIEGEVHAGRTYAGFPLAVVIAKAINEKCNGNVKPRIRHTEITPATRLISGPRAGTTSTPPVSEERLVRINFDGIETPLNGLTIPSR